MRKMSTGVQQEPSIVTSTGPPLTSFIVTDAQALYQFLGEGSTAQKAQECELPGALLQNGNDRNSPPGRR